MIRWRTEKTIDDLRAEAVADDAAADAQAEEMERLLDVEALSRTLVVALRARGLLLPVFLGPEAASAAAELERLHESADEALALEALAAAPTLDILDGGAA